MKMEKKKYVSDFVKRQKALDARTKPKLVWDSSRGNTYVRPKVNAVK